MHFLQLMQNDGARVLTKTKMCEYITPFTALLIVFEAMNGSAPSYVVEMLTKHTPDRPLISSGKGLLSILRMNSKSAHGAFRVLLSGTRTLVCYSRDLL